MIECAMYLDLSDPDKYYPGIFLSEATTRFSGAISLEMGYEGGCYIPFSSKLSKHLSPVGEEIIVEKIEKVDNLPYRLLAIKKSNCWFFVDLNKVNALTRQLILDRSESGELLEEKAISQGFRPDFSTIQPKRRIWEVKTLLDESEEVLYPRVLSRRSQKQFQKMLELLTEGWEITLVFVLLNPKIVAVRINQKQKAYYELFCQLVEAGMKIESFIMENSELGFSVKENPSKLEIFL